MAERHWRAMGTDAHVIVAGPERLADVAVDRIADLEARWSRFRNDSEVSRLTRCAGTAVAVSADTELLVRRAVEAWRLSGARFDPTVLGDVVRAGYDRPFDDLDGLRRAGISALRQNCAGIVVADHRVTLPAGTGFDPGGIGKGLAADLVVDELLADGADGACVNLGGDLRVSGESPEGGTWTVSIDHVDLDGPLALVGLARGAVATSTTLRRRWPMADGQVHHHLIDPLTGRPTDTDLAHVSVVADEAWKAEILAKAVLLRGGSHPFDLLGGTGAEALAVDVDGFVHLTGGFRSFTGAATPPTRVGPAASCTEWNGIRS